MHPIFTNHGFSSFFERLPHRLRTDVIGVPQFHQLAGQQTNGPTPPARRRLAARQRDQVSLLFAVQLAQSMPRLGTPSEDRIQAFLHEGLANAIDGCQPDSKGRAELLIGPAGTKANIGLEQNPGTGDLSSGGSPLAHQGLQALPLLIGQLHQVLLVHRGCLPPGNQRNYSQNRTRHQPFNKSWSGH
jgi:hypothetical protein